MKKLYSFQKDFNRLSNAIENLIKKKLKYRSDVESEKLAAIEVKCFVEGYLEDRIKNERNV